MARPARVWICFRTEETPHFYLAEIPEGECVICGGELHEYEATDED